MAGLEPDIVMQRKSGDEVVVHIRELGDFHPDRLFDALPLFRSLRDLRKRLSNAATFADAARELLGEGGPTTDRAPVSIAPRTGHVLDAILGGPLDEPGAATPAADELQALIQRSIAPHLVAADDPRRPLLMKQVDALIAEQMRAVLHHRSFQSLESLWRGVAMLTNRLETGELLQVHLLDISIVELVADAAAAGESVPSALSRVIADDGQPWALIVGAFTFGWDDADLLVLEHLASIARCSGGGAGAPFVAGAAPRLTGTPSFTTVSDVDEWSRETIPAWEAFRRSPNAKFVGLVAPRFLARVPYGSEGEPCEQFDFQEMARIPGHADFCWTNGALACALLLGQSFMESGWRLRPGMRREVDNLPYYVVHADTETYLQPCAEILLTERAANRMMERGLMPLASVKGRDVALLVRFQSVASPISALAGRWAERAEGGA